MTPRWKGLLSLAGSFAGLAIFWITMALFGLKPAIAATMAFVILDGARRLILRVPTPSLYMFGNLMALAFGVIDLTAKTPFMIRYEGVITNLITAAFFARDAFSRRPMFLDFAERSRGAPFPDSLVGMTAFFRAFTLAWTAYFVLKAGLFLWLVQAFPLPRALILRSIIGTGSLLVMMAISFQGRRVYEICQRLGLFGGRAALAAAAAHREEAA